MEWLIGKFGFDEPIWSKLPTKHRWWLFASAVLVVTSSLAWALAGSYVSFVSTKTQSMRWLICAGVFLSVFVLAFNFRRLVTTMGGFPLHKDRQGIEIWRPNHVRLFVVFFLSLLFSQPLLMLMWHYSLESSLSKTVELRVNGFKLEQESILKRRIDENTLEMSALLDQLGLVSTLGSKFSSNLYGETTSRKALVIGASNYSNYAPLPNVINDVRAIRAMLEKQGFFVTQSLDENSDTVKERINQYIKGLNASDVSVIFFAGHGLQFSGQNFLIPFDFPPLPAPYSPSALHNYAILANGFVEQLDNRYLKMNLVLLDACREFVDKDQGLAKMETQKSRNAVIMLAAAPNGKAKEYVDKSDKNSPFTSAVLKNFIKQEPFSRVITFVTRDVSNATQDAQKPVSTVSLVDVDFQLAERPPVLGSKSDKSNTTSSASNQLKPNINQDCSILLGQERSLCVAGSLGVLSLANSALNKSLEQDVTYRSEQYSNTLMSTGQLMDRLKLVWHNPYLASALTILIVTFLVLGDLMRDTFWLAPLRRYEDLRHIANRDYSRLTHAYHHAEINNALKLKGIHTSGFDSRWNKVTDFYSFQNHKPTDHYLRIQDESTWGQLISKLNKNPQ
jgi:hypothetical protein